MRIAVPKEIAQGETRVALTPESASKLIEKHGHSLVIEKGAGWRAGFPDEAYQKAGFHIQSDAPSLYAEADLILRVQKPALHPSGKAELQMMKKEALFVGFFWPLFSPHALKEASDAGLSVLAMDAVPRISRAQSMDALSSQSNLGGYKAVILAANHLHKIFPLLMTAAGTVSPAKVVILGAGVAGLQAIATAKRLGALVEVSDVRPSVKEQVESLGARYIEPPQEEDTQQEEQKQGGYAKEVSKEYLKKQQAILEKHIAQADAIISTALIPGKKAPILLPRSLVEKMKPGSVIVDMAAEQGGNCEVTEAGANIEHSGVSIIGSLNLPATMPYHASQLYARNITALLEYISRGDGAIHLDLEDEIIKGCLCVYKGEIRQLAK